MDITDRFLEITQTIRVPFTDPYRGRLLASEIPSSDSHYISETSSLLFLLIDTSRSLKELISSSNSRINFQTQTSKIRTLSEKIENNIKICQLKLEEIQHIDLPSCCSSSIYDLLQMRLFTIVKDFQFSLQNRTKQLKNSQQNKGFVGNDFESVSKDRPTFLEDSENE